MRRSHQIIVATLLTACSAKVDRSEVALPEVDGLDPEVDGVTRLAGVRRGTRALSLRPVGHRLEGRTEVTRRSEFDATRSPRAIGIEEQWRFDQAPRGEGDLEVALDTNAEWLATTSYGLAMQLDGSRFNYGHGTWVDATGRRTPIPARWVQGRIVLRVPDLVVNDTIYPAVLDPIIGTLAPLTPPELVPSDLSFSQLFTDGAVELFVADSRTFIFRDMALSDESPGARRPFLCISSANCVRVQSSSFIRYDPLTGEDYPQSIPAGFSLQRTEGGLVMFETNGPSRDIVQARHFDAEMEPVGSEITIESGTRISLIQCSDGECIVRTTSDSVYRVTRAGSTLLPVTLPVGEYLFPRGAEGFWRLPRGGGSEVTLADGSLNTVTSFSLSATSPSFYPTRRGDLFVLGISEDPQLIRTDGTVVEIDPPTAGIRALECGARCVVVSDTSRETEFFEVDEATGALTSLGHFALEYASHFDVAMHATNTESTITWGSRSNDDAVLYSGFLGSDGRLVGDPIELLRVDLGSKLTGVVPSVDGWVVAWDDHLIGYDMMGPFTSSAADLGGRTLDIATQDGVRFVVPLMNELQMSLRVFDAAGAPLTAGPTSLGVPAARDLFRARSADASVASGPDNFLIVTSVEGARSDDIVGVRVNDRGEVLDPAPLPISSGDSGQVLSDVVDDGDGWLVVWEDHRDGSEVWGARVDYDGTRPALDGVRLSPDGVHATAPTVVFDGSDAFVFYFVQATSEEEGDAVMAQRVRGLTPRGAPVLVATHPEVDSYAASGDLHGSVQVAAGIRSAPAEASQLHTVVLRNDVDGAICADASECESGVCAEGFCCDRACDSPCETCARATGASENGVCGVRAAGGLCRASTGVCDPAETCDGVEPLCPPEMPPPAECVDAGEPDAGPADAGPADSGSPDAGLRDAGSDPFADGGDAGSPRDAGTSGDARSEVDDAGPPEDDGGCSVGHGRRTRSEILLVSLALLVLRRRRRRGPTAPRR